MGEMICSIEHCGNYLKLYENYIERETYELRVFGTQTYTITIYLKDIVSVEYTEAGHGFFGNTGKFHISVTGGPSGHLNELDRSRNAYTFVFDEKENEKARKFKQEFDKLMAKYK